MRLSGLTIIYMNLPIK